MSVKIKTRKILVLEDDTSLRGNLVEILILKGFEVLKADNGYIGIQMALKHLPNIILCSRMFADIDCLDVFQALQKQEETKNIPFIFLSSNPSGQRHLEMQKIQIPKILIKPFSIQELMDFIQGCLHKQALS